MHEVCALERRKRPPESDNDDPNFVELLKLMEDPIVTNSKVDNPPAKRNNDRIDKEDPIETKLRILVEDPARTKARNDILEPKDK
jgi:hypothetical protein